MQSVLSVSRRWHDPLPRLRRAAVLLSVVASLDAAAILLQHGAPVLSPIYGLALLRTADIVLLLRMGPWLLSREYHQIGLRVSFPTALILGVSGAVLATLLRIPSGLSPFEGARGALLEGCTLLAFLVTSCFLAPVAEELVFRGLIYRIVRQWGNAWVCTLMVSLLFAGLHQAFGQRPLIPFCGSLIFCLAYEKSKSIHSPILLHIAGNLIIYLPPLFR